MDFNRYTTILDITDIEIINIYTHIFWYDNMCVNQTWKRIEVTFYKKYCQCIN